MLLLVVFVVSFSILSLIFKACHASSSSNFKVASQTLVRCALLSLVSAVTFLLFWLTPHVTFLLSAEPFCSAAHLRVCVCARAEDSCAVLCNSLKHSLTVHKTQLSSQKTLTGGDDWREDPPPPPYSLSPAPENSKSLIPCSLCELLQTVSECVSSAITQMISAVSQQLKDEAGLFYMIMGCHIQSGLCVAERGQLTH